ncbi:MAG: 50S ribosomal protein L28 [Bradymonadales bacterium]|jgi:large subunit ribosomal protein L28
MARKCQLTGKGPLVGYNVSHAHNKTKKRQLPNLQRKRIFCPELKRFVHIRLSARALRSVSKMGLHAYLNKTGVLLRDIEY